MPKQQSSTAVAAAQGKPTPAPKPRRASRGAREIGLAGFDFAALNQRYRTAPNNDASHYGVAIQPATVAPGATYWKAIGVYHLTPDENRSRHHIFVDVLNEGGQRAKEMTVSWTWDGNSEPAKVNRLDKPDNEPGTDIPLFGSVFRLTVQGSDPSDTVTGLHTQHADERNGTGEILNSVGHHSFYVVFQRVRHHAAVQPSSGDPQVTTPATLGTNGTSGTTSFPTKPTLPLLGGRIQARDKLGIDANQPIDPASGAIAPQVADPNIIADTGVGWVRLNFVLALDHVASYQQIIAGFRRRGLRIYGLVHSQVMDDPGDQFRDPIAGGLSNEWINRYADNFVRIVELFHQDVKVFESFNEPDDWHRSNRNWIHPTWFALMLHEIHKRVRSHPDPRVAGVQLVSGPLQGLDINNNAGAEYLRQTYHFGKTALGWGSSTPFPFDGVGYHLYIAQGGNNTNADIQRDYHGYLDQVRQVIREAEGAEKPIYLSEFGWQTQHVGAARQVECLNFGTQLVLQDPTVALGFWFCTQDFPGEDFGLYRQGSLGPENRKPLYEALRTLCSTTVDLPMPVTGASSTGTPTSSGPLSPPAVAHTVQWVGVVTAGELNVRNGPGINHVQIGSLLQNREVAVVGQEGDWLRILWNDGTAFVFAKYVVNRDRLADMQMSVSAVIAPTGADPQTTTVANTWNRYRTLLEQQAARLGIDPAVAVAVLVAEANGAAFGADGRMIIRFENHIFYERWGQQNAATFHQHFGFDADRPWVNQVWRAAPNANWQPCHTNQQGEWLIFDFARRFNPTAALLSISMGAPQIMGFNHQMIGYPTVQAMFDAFQQDDDNQIHGLFRFIEAKGLADALRQGDLRRFAEGYNGLGQADLYAGIIQRNLVAFQSLQASGTRGMASRAVTQPALTAPRDLSADWQQQWQPGLTETFALLARALQGVPVHTAADALNATQLGIILHNYWAQLGLINPTGAGAAQEMLQRAAADTLNRLHELTTQDRGGVFVENIALPLATLTNGPAPTGKRKPQKRALCIGIDAYAQSPLQGCVADANLWAKTLLDLGFAQPTMLINQQATRAAILQAVRSLIADSQEGDVLVIQFAGHGIQLTDVNGDEKSGDTPNKDEALVPFDFLSGAYVIDDDLSAIFATIPAGVNVTCFMDCCHSGSNTRAGLNDRPRRLVEDDAIRTAHRGYRQLLGGSRGGGKREVEAMAEVVFSACQSTEFAWESDGHGEFTLHATTLLNNGGATLSHEVFVQQIIEAFGPTPRQTPLLECAAAGRGRTLLQVVAG